MANFVQASSDNAVITFLVGDTQYADKVATFSMSFRDDNAGGTLLTFDWTDSESNLGWEISFGPYFTQWTNNAWIPPQGGSKTPMGTLASVVTYLQYPQNRWQLPIDEWASNANVTWLEVPEGWIGDWRCTIERIGLAEIPAMPNPPNPTQDPVTIKFFSVSFTVTAAGIIPVPNPPQA